MKNETPEKINDEEIVKEVPEEVEEYELPKEGEGYVLQHEVPEEKEYEIPEDVLEEHPLIPSPPKKSRLYAGIFSVIGLTFVIMTVLAVIATIIFLRWDTWITGASEENIGDYQILYVYIGTIWIVVCAVASLVDVYQHRKGQ